MSFSSNLIYHSVIVSLIITEKSFKGNVFFPDCFYIFLKCSTFIDNTSGLNNVQLEKLTAPKTKHLGWHRFHLGCLENFKKIANNVKYSNRYKFF